MLGSQGKRALERGVARNPSWTGRDAAAVCAMMRDHIGAQTKEFREIQVVEVPPIERPEKQESGAKIKGIQKVRHVTLTAPGHLLARETACFACMADLDKVCPVCAALPSSYPKAKARKHPAPAAPPAEEEGQDEGAAEHEDVHLDEPIPDPFDLITEVDRADAEEDDEEEVAARKGEEQADHGDVIWARERRGSYWPGQAVPYSLVPAAVATKYGARVGDNLTWVRLFGRGEEAYKPIPPWDVFPFQGNTVFDLQAKGEEKEREAAYNMAIYALNGH